LDRFSVNSTIIHSYSDSKVQIVNTEGRRRNYPAFSEHTNVASNPFSDCKIFWDSSRFIPGLIARKTVGSRIILQQAFVHLYTESPSLNFVPNVSRHKLPCYLSDFFTYIEKDRLPFKTDDCDEINIHWTLCRGVEPNPPRTDMPWARKDVTERLNLWIINHLHYKA
jgi:hypothetical protein